MSIKYKCGECGHEFSSGTVIQSDTMENICPNCRSNNISIPIELMPVKTLNKWFANLPLIQKIDHYNSHIKIIANNLK